MNLLFSRDFGARFNLSGTNIAKGLLTALQKGRSANGNVAACGNLNF
jgi:hypothetical protein